jgi:hypothetical protein
VPNAEQGDDVSVPAALCGQPLVCVHQQGRVSNPLRLRSRMPVPGWTRNRQFDSEYLPEFRYLHTSDIQLQPPIK